MNMELISDNHGEIKVSLLLLVECDLLHGVRKIRCCLRGRSSAVSEINCQIMKCIGDNENTAYHIDIFNPKSGQLEGLKEQSESICIHDFIDKFGTKIRCVVQCIVNSEDNGKANLLIKGRYFEYCPDGVEFSGKWLVVKEDVNNQMGTGLNVWDGALLLSRYLEKMPSKVKSKSILELGSGPAFVGIASAVLGARQVAVSDLSYTMKLMKSNVQLNSAAIKMANCSQVDCLVLDWFNPPSIENLPFVPEVILIADCVWVEHLVDPLMNTVHLLCGNATTVIITYQRRGRATHELFWKRLQDIFSEIVEVDTKASCGLDKPESLSLLLCQKR